LDYSSFSPAYDDEEPEYDPDEPVEPDGETAHHDDLDNPDALNITGESGRDVVDIGKEQVTAPRNKGPEVNKNKKIPKEERKTTPYMTKYERARVLGTRALQIR
jgi:DNA-directed RNA polymerase I, II, and III subunit RPABC2